MERAKNLYAHETHDHWANELKEAVEAWSVARDAFDAMPKDAALSERMSALKRVERMQLQIAHQAKVLIRGLSSD